MARRVTLELADEVLDRAERLAVLTHRDVNELLAEAVSAVLPTMDLAQEGGRPVSELSDVELLRLADASLPVQQDRRLSELLDQQQAGTLSGSDRAELLALMHVYEASWLRQAEALAEAVRRGLRKPFTP